jgi:hypothetical protein
MPDIKTALEEAIAKTKQQWANESLADEAPTNLSRTIFNFIRDNPNFTPDQVVAALAPRGFKVKSIQSLISQMIKVRLVILRESGGLSAVVKEYVPIKSSGKKKQQRALKKFPATKAVKSPAPDPVPEPVAEPAVKPWSVESAISNLNVHQAMAVYQELHKIFGR